MRWGQVKLILIAALLLVNLAMLTLLVSDYQREHYIDATYVEEAVPLLAARGIEVEVEAVPRLKCAMVTQRLAPAGTRMTAFLRALLGETGEYQPVTEYRNGYGSYRTEDYFSFSATFAEGYPEVFRRTGEVKEFLERAIGAEEFELVQENIRRDGDHRVVRFREYARGVQIEGCYLDATLDGGELREVQGKLTSKTPRTGNQYSIHYGDYPRARDAQRGGRPLRSGGLPGRTTGERRLSSADAQRLPQHLGDL